MNYLTLQVGGINNIKIYNSEDTLFNHEGHSTFSLSRKKLKAKLFPELSDIFIIFLISLPLYLYVNTKLQFTLGTGTSLFFSQWGLFFGGAIIFLKFYKINITQSLSLKNPGSRNLICSFLLAPGCYALVILLQNLLAYFGYKGATGMETVEVMKALNQQYSLLGTIFLISVTPAICEEVFFRGLLLSGLRQKYNLRSCMLIQALMFGLAHYSVFRFAPTAIMGAILTCVLIRSGSIYCTILIHFIFNSISCLAWYYDIDDKMLEPFIYYIIAYGVCSMSLFFLLKPKAAAPAEEIIKTKGN